MIDDDRRRRQSTTTTTTWRPQARAEIQAIIWKFEVRNVGGLFLRSSEVLFAMRSSEVCSVDLFAGMLDLQGWLRYAPHVDGFEVYKGWCVAYHGTTSQHMASILI